MCHSLAMYSRCFVSCIAPDSKLGLQAKWDMLRARTSLPYVVVNNINVTKRQLAASSLLLV